MVRELREIDAAGRLYFGVTEYNSAVGAFWSVLVRRRDGHRFPIAEDFGSEQEDISSPRTAHARQTRRSRQPPCAANVKPREHV
jgi:hypothetical protein